MSVQTMQSMIRWIDNNITKEPTLQQMSAFVGYSPYYCSVKFREYTKMTYRNYLAEQKLRLAAAEVEQKNDKIVDIALRCGYSSHEAFTRAFAGRFGCTPRQYRKHTEAVRKAVKPWHCLGDMGHTVHTLARESGYSVVREVGGHGIGLEFHEDPWVSYVSAAVPWLLMKRMAGQFTPPTGAYLRSRKLLWLLPIPAVKCWLTDG